MGKKVFKGICIASIVLFVLLVLFTFSIWILANVGVVLMYMLSMGNGNFSTEGISLAKFLENFVGSPLFYVYVADMLIFVVSVIGLIATKRKHKQDQGVFHGEK